MDIETTIHANHRLKRRIKNTVYYSQLDAPPATLKAEFCNLNFSPMTSGLNIFTDLHIIAHDHWNWIFFLHSRIIGIGSSSSTPRPRINRYPSTVTHSPLRYFYFVK